MKKIKKQMLDKLTEQKKPIKCCWCNRKATMKDYRTIDGTTGSIPSCDKCITLSTEYLLERIK